MSRGSCQQSVRIGSLVSLLTLAAIASVSALSHSALRAEPSSDAEVSKELSKSAAVQTGNKCRESASDDVAHRLHRYSLSQCRMMG